ncbi:MAG: hypothetical protein COW63_04235 [Bacteroidetes bacterium CG18_big_fil_WC_8_21_14_2_50_41_14]|nr:MAG: hypothetical protein COW63_04235 [Bacteroidetes bacterium CG18_big_fil_WC_8_21_14_2_50_41_14]
MSKYTFILLVLISIQVSIKSKLIIWRESEKLTYDDFQGQLPALIYHNEGAVATTSVIMKDIADYTDSNVVINIYAVFDCEKSWIFDNIKNEKVLNHEQRHFDITEYYARKLRSEIKDLPRINLLMQININECDIMQDLYDRDTNHGNDSISQQYWNQKVDSLLTSMKEFRNTEVHLYP